MLPPKMKILQRAKWQSLSMLIDFICIYPFSFSRWARNRGRRDSIGTISFFNPTSDASEQPAWKLVALTCLRSSSVVLRSFSLWSPDDFHHSLVANSSGAPPHDLAVARPSINRDAAHREHPSALRHHALLELDRRLPSCSSWPSILIVSIELSH